MYIRTTMDDVNFILNLKDRMLEIIDMLSIKDELKESKFYNLIKSKYKELIIEKKVKCSQQKINE